MRGYCKCDLCGNVYHEDANDNYDGLMVWYAYSDDDVKSGNRKDDIVAPNGETLKGTPEMMDVCPRCLGQFCDWIKAKKAESKSDDDFPMNKPE